MAALFGYLCAVVLILSSLLIGFASVFDGGNHSQVLDKPKIEALNKVERQKAEAVKDRIEGADKTLSSPTATPDRPAPAPSAAVEPATSPAAPAVSPPKREATVTAPSPAPGAKTAKPEKKKVVRKSRPAQRPYMDQDDYEDRGWVVERRERRGIFGLFADE